MTPAPVAVISPRPIPNPAVPRAARRTLGWSAAAAVGALVALAIAVLAGGPAVAQIIDRTSRHAALASRGGQLALLRLLLLAGCAIVLVAIARRARQQPTLLAGCLAGVEGATLLATPGVGANSLTGPPSLVDLVQLAAASVWAGTIAVMAVAVLPALHRNASTGPGMRRASLALTLLVSAAGTWLAGRHLVGAPAASGVVFRQLITAEGALLIAALGVAAIRWLNADPATRSSFGTADAPLDVTGAPDRRPMARALVLAVAALLVVSGMVAVIPAHPSGRSASQPAPARSARGT
jgi:putative copper export protein